MVRAPCCEKMGLKKGPWTPEEDRVLVSYIKLHGHGNWRALPKQAGLPRCGKSCRLRWTNYLRPDIKRGNFTREEEDTIIALHNKLGNRWSAIAARLPGRTDNEIKNVWHTHLKKRLPPSPTSPSAVPSERNRKHIPAIQLPPPSPSPERSFSDEFSASSIMDLEKGSAARKCDLSLESSPELPAIIDEIFWSEVPSERKKKHTPAIQLPPPSPSLERSSVGRSFSSSSINDLQNGDVVRKCNLSMESSPDLSAIIDDSFWSEADAAAAECDFGRGGCPFSGDHDMFFWLNTFFEAGEALDLPEI